MAIRRIFWGFCRNWFLIDPLDYLSSRSAFGFVFPEIFEIEKRLRDSASRRVDDSPTWRVGESTTPRLAESESCFSFTNISANSKPEAERLER
jgi:hypothetical protein